MKRLLFIIPAFCLSVSVFSQVYFPIVEEGKVWSTLHRICSFYQYSDFNKFEGDTVLNGMTYKKVWTTLDTNLTGWTLSGKIREENRKVYYGNINSPSEYLIYNFMAEVGDTFCLRTDYPYVLDSVGTTVLENGESRPIYYLSNTYNTGWFETWIEGVGCNYGVLNGGYCGISGDNPFMLCFTEQGILKYKNPDYENCYVLTGTPDPETNLFTIYPNPASGNFTIQFRDPPAHPFTLEFISPEGKRVNTISLPGKTNSMMIQTPKYPGLFFYRLIINDKIMGTGKLFVY